MLCFCVRVPTWLAHPSWRDTAAAWCPSARPRHPAGERAGRTPGRSGPDTPPVAMGPLPPQTHFCWSTGWAGNERQREGRHRERGGRKSISKSGGGRETLESNQQLWVRKETPEKSALQWREHTLRSLLHCLPGCNSSSRSPSGSPGLPL